MRLVFVHGINNQDNTPQEIEAYWWRALEDGWKALGLTPKSKPSIDVAYYADLLAAASKGHLGEAVAMGGETEAGRAAAVAFLREYAEAAGVTQEELARVAAATGVPIEAVEQGVPHEGWVVALGGLLERILPTKGKYMARLFLRQASLYIENEGLRDKIDALVKSQICDNKDDPAVVVAHSLGTVVSYRILGHIAQGGRNVPLYVTLGSPLAVGMFRPLLPPRGTLPNPPLGKWLNGRHKEDFVTLGRAITKAAIGFDGVIDETDIVNDEDDKHSIRHYLMSPEIARAIYNAL